MRGGELHPQSKLRSPYGRRGHLASVRASSVFRPPERQSQGHPCSSRVDYVQLPGIWRRPPQRARDKVRPCERRAGNQISIGSPGEPHNGARAASIAKMQVTVVDSGCAQTIRTLWPRVNKSSDLYHRHRGRPVNKIVPLLYTLGHVKVFKQRDRQNAKSRCDM